MSIFRRISNLFSRSKADREVDAEIASHIEMRTADNIAAGMSPEEARRDALLRFGNPAVMKERVAAADAALVLERISSDLLYAVRQLVKNPAFFVGIVLTVSLGIGANTAMFSVIRAVLLKPLAYHDPNRLVLITGGATPIRFEEMTASSRSYTGIGAFVTGHEDVALSGSGQPEVLKGARVSANFLDILGVKPLLGRGFLPPEDRPGAPNVAMISAELWQRRFDGRPSLLGRAITLEGAPYTIVGILPAGFQFPNLKTDVWLTRPSEWPAIPPASRRISPILHVFGRLKPNVSIRQANAELVVTHRRYDLAHPGMLDSSQNLARIWNRDPDHVDLFKDQLVSDIRSKLWLLFGALGLVLLIVCANVVSLLLARATSRSQEFALRAAIGAGRGRIIAQLLTESILLASIGGALGVVLAGGSLAGIRTMTALHLPRAGEIGIDGAVLGFATILSLMTGILFGLLPARYASRPNLEALLRGSGEGAGSTGVKPMFLRFSPRALLVAGQVALSTVLLIGAALLIESLDHAYRVDPGFEAGNILTMSFSLPSARYDTDEKRSRFYKDLIGRVETLPGVKSAGLTLTLPMAGFAMSPVAVIGQPETELNQRPLGIVEFITTEYLKTMKIALKRGRQFTIHDDLESPPVAIIDERMAHRFWPQYPGGPNPVGQHILIGAHSKPTEIVGIVSHIRQRSLDKEPRPGVYLSLAQQPPASAMLAVKTEGDPLSFAGAVRGKVLAIDRDQPVSAVASMNEVVDASVGQLRAMTTLLGMFAGVATLIAIVGLYGVVAYSVAQRTKEIGIRRALGAQRADILTLVVRDGLRLALGGVLLGLSGAFALTRALQGLLFQIKTTDPLTFVSTAFTFVLVAAIASFIPARRAAAIDPLTSLRRG